MLITENCFTQNSMHFERDVKWCSRIDRTKIKSDPQLQDAAERTPRFGRGIASGGERVQWWRARLRTAVYVPFSVYTGVVGRTSSLYC